MNEMISSASNPLIKKIRALKQPKARRDAGLFLVEGIHHVGEAEEAGWKFDFLVYAPELLSSEYASSLVKKISEKGIRCVPVQGDLFSSISEKDNPQGILAVAMKKNRDLGELPRTSGSLFVALVSPQDPGNIGTILRTIDSSGADGLILLDGGADPYHSTSVRASMGSIFWIPFIQISFEEFSRWAGLKDCYMIGTSAHAEADYKTLRLPQESTVLLFGSEQKGLSENHLQNCDIAVSIPMRGRSSSLNLAVAAGIMLYSLKG